MSNRFFSYQQTALNLIGIYQRKMPFHLHLRQYFVKNKKHGSQDRRWIAHFCYSFFRLGKALSTLKNKEKMLVGIYLCTEDQSKLEVFFPADWPLGNPLEARLQWIRQQYANFDMKDIFPYSDVFAAGVNIAELCKSYLVQPDVFLRIRPGQRAIVVAALENGSIAFRNISENCISVANSVAVNTLLPINKSVVVQDLNSQRIAQLFPTETTIETIWDCCAASGGKTILLRDCFPQARISVSDIRPSILANLQQRMAEAGVVVKDSFVVDLSLSLTTSQQYDFVLCDAPCSGSGTWGRTPEELYFFEREELNAVMDLQRNIVSNITAAVKPGGYLLYVTCSLFAVEDEDVVEFILGGNQFELIEQKLFAGWNAKADTLFGALLRCK